MLYKKQILHSKNQEKKNRVKFELDKLVLFLFKLDKLNIFMFSLIKNIEFLLNYGKKIL